MRSIFAISVLAFSCSFSLVEAAPSRQKEDTREVQRLRTKIELLRDEISDLRSSVSSLESLSTKLTQEVNTHEAHFKKRFEQILVPLLNWPAISVSSRVPSWTEQGHLKLVLFSARKRIAEAPLNLISSRETRIREAEAMKEEFQSKLKILEEKEGFLDLQIEELQLMERVASRKKTAPKEKRK